MSFSREYADRTSLSSWKSCKHNSAVPAFLIKEQQQQQSEESFRITS